MNEGEDLIEHEFVVIVIAQNNAYYNAVSSHNGKIGKTIKTIFRPCDSLCKITKPRSTAFATSVEK